MKTFHGKVNALTEKLDEIFPRRSAEDWLAIGAAESQKQTAELKNIGVDVEAIHESFDERISDAIENLCTKLDEKLLSHSEKICAAIEKLGTGGTEKIGEIFSAGVGSQMERFSAALDRFSDSIDEKLRNADEVSQIMNEQLLDTLERLSGTLNELAEKIKTQQETAAKDFETLIRNTLDNFNATMKQILARIKAERDADNANRKADAVQVHKVSEKFLATLAGLSKTLQEVAEQKKKFLTDTATSNAAQISKAIAAFREIVDNHNATMKKTFTQVQNQLAETEKFLREVNTAGNSLKQAAEPVRQSTVLLAKNLSETSAQMANLSAANQTTRQNLYLLSEELKEFVGSFKGIASEFEKSARIIQDCLDNYNVKTNAGLKEKLETFDKVMSDAVGHLQSSIEDLSNALEDLKQIRRR